MTTPWDKLEAFENKHGDWYYLLNEYVQAKYRTPENPKKAIEYDKLLKNHDKISRLCNVHVWNEISEVSFKRKL